LIKQDFYGGSISSEPIICSELFDVFKNRTVEIFTQRQVLLCSTTLVGHLVTTV